MRVIGQKPGQIQSSERISNMYSKEQRTQALRVYHRIGPVTETVRRLEDSEEQGEGSGNRRHEE